MLTFRGAELYFFQSRRSGSKWAEIITKIIIILAIVFLIIGVRGGKWSWCLLPIQDFDMEWNVEISGNSLKAKWKVWQRRIKCQTYTRAQEGLGFWLGKFHYHYKEINEALSVSCVKEARGCLLWWKVPESCVWISTPLNTSFVF